MVDIKQRAEEAAKINNLLMKEPEYEQAVLIFKDIEDCRGAIKHSKEQIDREKGEIEACESLIEGYKNDIKCLLEKLEANTGFTKFPGLAHLTTIPASYDVVDLDAVPKEYIRTKITAAVDKVSLNKAIKSGAINPADTNWLTEKPAYRTLVIGE